MQFHKLFFVTQAKQIPESRILRSKPNNFLALKEKGKKKKEQRWEIRQVSKVKPNRPKLQIHLKCTRKKHRLHT